MSDAVERFKATQREGWAHFAPLAAMTTAPAAGLAAFAGIHAGDRVLDVACGTGVVAVTAARLGAHVTGLDLTPALLAVARDNARLAGVDITFHEGDCEQLPFDTDAFDVVVSQFGHMFAPRPDTVVREMLRVLASNGTLAFSTWPPELCVGQLLALAGRYLPPPPIPAAPPALWGDPAVIRERLGQAVHDMRFDRGTMVVPALSPAHNRVMTERTVGPIMALVERLGATDPPRLAAFRDEFEAIVGAYFSGNTIRQDFLMTRATKR